MDTSTSTTGETAAFEYNANDAITLMTDQTGSTTNLYDPAGRLYGVNTPRGRHCPLRVGPAGPN